MDPDIKRNKHANIDKKLQMQWIEPKNIILEVHVISYFQEKKGLLQLMGPTCSRTWGFRGKNSNILRKKKNARCNRISST